MASVHRKRGASGAISPYWNAKLKGPDGSVWTLTTKLREKKLARALAREWETAAEVARNGRLTHEKAQKLLAECADITRGDGAEQWLRNALVFLPDHPLLHIALAGLETDSKRADFLCSFALARLPKDSVFCTRAGEMLLAQHRPELALAAIDKALVADPTNLLAQRLRLKVLDAMPR